MEIIESKKAPAAIGPYSQAVKTGNLLITSGSIPIDASTGQVVDGGIDEQTHMVCKNVGYLMEAAGLGFKNIVKTTCFLSDMADFAEFNKVYEQYFISKPARSTVAVKGLPRNVLVEIEVIAEY